LTSIIRPVSVHYTLLQTLDSGLITNFRRPPSTVTSICVELWSPSYFELSVPDDPRRSSPPDAEVAVNLSSTYFTWTLNASQPTTRQLAYVTTECYGLAAEFQLTPWKGPWYYWSMVVLAISPWKKMT
jgi:hypothetical protein